MGEKDDRFALHLKRSSEIVKSWPKWKQNVLGGKMPTNPQSLAGLTAEEKKRIGKITGGIFEDRVEMACGNLKLGIGVGMRPSSVIDLARTILRMDTALSRSRASEDRKKKLLKKHEWHAMGPEGEYCLECYCCKKNGHNPDCAIAAELEGTEGE